ncbi:MAG: hypothetical protein [Microvirus sp.]|nr:MAG: hypothetical protein [Microvirus sp.]
MYQYDEHVRLYKRYRPLIKFWKGLLMKRHKMSQNSSKRVFKKHADLTHKKNLPKRQPMRGGIRL